AETWVAPGSEPEIADSGRDATAQRPDRNAAEVVAREDDRLRTITAGVLPAWEGGRGGRLEQSPVPPRGTRAPLRAPRPRTPRPGPGSHHPRWPCVGNTPW